MDIETQEFWDETNSDATATTSNDLSKVLVGALAGAVAGALVGGLFTKKGVEIRNRMGEGSKCIANNIKDKVADLSAGIADKFEATKEGAAEMIEKGKQKIGISHSHPAYATENAYNGFTGAEDSNPGAKILLGAIIISVASSIVWSFATEKGNTTRRRLFEGSKNITNNFKDKVSEMASEIKEGIANTYEAAKEGAIDLLEKEKQKIDAIAAGNTAPKRSTEGNM